MAEFPLLKMINVLERQVPFAYPQHSTLSRGYVETGEENPLPSKDELVNKTLTELKETLESQELKVKDVKITNAIEVSNLPETQKVEITNQKESQDVKVTNQPEDYPDEAVRDELEVIKGTQSEIISALQTTNENLLATNEHLNSVIKDDRLQSDTQVIGSNVEDAIPTKKEIGTELEKIVDAEVLEGSTETGVIYMNPKNASEIYLFVSIDKHPWELRYRNQFGSVSSHNGYPNYIEEDKGYTSNTPAISFPLGYRPNHQGIPSPTTIKEAKDWGLPITDNEYFKIFNQSDETATVTVSILRVWR